MSLMLSGEYRLVGGGGGGKELEGRGETEKIHINWVPKVCVLINGGCCGPVVPSLLACCPVKVTCLSCCQVSTDWWGEGGGIGG